MSNDHQRNSLKQALFAGACAGTAVDTVLFPLGTIKYYHNLSAYLALFIQTRSRHDYNRNMGSLLLVVFEAFILVY